MREFLADEQQKLLRRPQSAITLARPRKTFVLPAQTTLTTVCAQLLTTAKIFKWKLVFACVKFQIAGKLAGNRVPLEKC